MRVNKKKKIFSEQGKLAEAVDRAQVGKISLLLKIKKEATVHISSILSELLDKHLKPYVESGFRKKICEFKLELLA